ncbi:hypothetical protein PO909_020480, partial [Leuciscus waleckii]
MSPTSVHYLKHQWALLRWTAAMHGYVTLNRTTLLHIRHFHLSKSTICTNPPMILNPRRKYNGKAKQMSLPQINHALKANEYSLKANGYDGRYNAFIKGFDSNILASNSPSEDRRSAATCLQSRGMLFGVFDGHAGSACAQAVSERLFYYIAVSLLPLKTLIDIEEAVESERPVLPVLQWHKHPNDYVSTDAGKLYFNSLRTYWQERIDLHE